MQDTDALVMATVVVVVVLDAGSDATCVCTPSVKLIVQTCAESSGSTTPGESGTP